MWSTSLLCSSCSWVVQFLDKVVDMLGLLSRATNCGVPQFGSRACCCAATGADGPDSAVGWT